MKEKEYIYGIKKKPISSTLKNMKVGDVERYPIERMASVRVTAYQVATQMRREKVVFSVIPRGLHVEVTRKR